MNIDLENLDVNKPEDRAVLWGLGVEIEFSPNNECWYKVMEHCLNIPYAKYRRKPVETPKRNITIPQCLTEAPAMGTRTWALNVYTEEGYYCVVFTDSLADRIAIRNGGYFATLEDVKVVVAALRV